MTDRILLKEALFLMSRMVMLTMKISTVKGDLLPAVGPAAVAAVAAFSGFILVEGWRGAWDDEADSVRVHLRG